MITNRWEEIHDQRDWGKYPSEDLVRFIGRNYFRIPKPERKKIKVLELGCGQGANLWFLAREGFDVYGIDFSPSAIKKTKITLKEWNVEINFLDVQDIRNLAFPANIFDVVIDVATICNVTFKDHFIAYNSIYRTLIPGGKFWSYHFDESSWGYGKGNLIDYKTFDNINEGMLKDIGTTCMLSDKDIETELVKVGFVDITIEKHMRTYDKQSRCIVGWIVDCVKPQ
jgi:ubiquinone/menaquinone biosynthesis C-methylase UbiE